MVARASKGKAWNEEEKIRKQSLSTLFWRFSSPLLLSFPLSAAATHCLNNTTTDNQERKNLTHREQAVLRVLVLGNARVDPSLPRHRVGRHRLDAAGQPHGVEARLDRRGHGRDRLQARAALPVDGVDRDGVRDPGEQGGDAALDGALRRVPEDRADDDVPDVLGVDARALDRGLEDGREEVVRAGVLEAAALGLSMHRIGKVFISFGFFLRSRRPQRQKCSLSLLLLVPLSHTTNTAPW